MTSLLDVRHGSRTPRVSKYPPGISSAGQEATELAASAGLILDPWQADVLDAALQEKADGKWAAFEVGLIVPRQNGKGSILEARELAGLFLFGERMIVHSAHEFKTSIEAFRRIRALIESTPDLDRKVNNYWMTTGREGIELKNGARLRFVARSKGSGRGFSGDLVIMDEAFALTDEHVEALLPTLSARPNPQVWYTSSPPLDGFTGEPLYALRRRGEAPTPPDGLCWMDWGAELDVDPDDREVWAATNPALGYRITEEFIARERAAMTDEGFKRERLGVWPRSSSAGWLVIPKGPWEDAAWPDMPRPEPLGFAVSVSEDQAWGAICAAGRVGDDEAGRPLYGVIVVDRRPGLGWLTDRLFELADKWEPVITICDRNSPANEIWVEVENRNLERLGSADLKQLEMTPISARDVKAAAAGLYTGIAGMATPDEETGEWLNPRNVRHRDQGMLNDAIAGAVKKTDTSGAWCFDPLLSDPVAKGCADALWGFKSRPEPVAEPWAFSL